MTIIVCMCGPGDNLQKLVRSLHYTGPGEKEPRSAGFLADTLLKVFLMDFSECHSLSALSSLIKTEYDFSQLYRVDRRLSLPLPLTQNDIGKLLSQA